MNARVKMAPRVSSPNYHGYIRGAEALHGSPQFEGRFGRMFRTLPAAGFADEDLHRLALAMTAEPEVVVDHDGNKQRDKDGRLIPRATPEDEIDDEENFGIAAGYTYLGQFIDHDITFDPVSSLQRQNDPEALVDYRTPSLDLDCIYGRGPADQPYLYDREGLRFVFGRQLTRGDQDSAAEDLPRFNGRALIGDKRNDENVIVSQLHGVFLKFHNRVATMMQNEDRRVKFEEVQRVVRWHYQWIVLHDFLPTLVGDSIVREILPHLKKPAGDIYADEPRLRFYHWKNEPFIPIEFSAAVYRFGHSMVRPIYRLNGELGNDASSDEVKRGIGGRQFIFAAVQDDALNGFREFPVNWAIDWKLFFEIEGKLETANRGVNRVQPSYKIDTSLVNPLGFLPEFSIPQSATRLRANSDGFPLQKPGEVSNLAYRNLLRGKSMGLPSGQTVAHHMGLAAIEDQDLLIGKATVEGTGHSSSIRQFGNSFRNNAPLWCYVLAEAQHEWRKRTVKPRINALKKNATPVTLGPVGGRIVAEVLIGLLLGDSSSFLSQWPKWKPWKQFTNNAGEFRMAELIKAAGLA